MEKNSNFTSIVEITALKAAPNQTILFLLKLHFLGHIVSDEETQLVAKRVHELKILKTPENKKDAKRAFGSLGFNRKFIKIFK